MSTLPSDQRRQLERAVKEARRIAQAGAQAAVIRLGVGAAKPPSYLTADEQALRRRLRAHARHLGDSLLPENRHETRRLEHEIAYEHWHRMLFARFLVENNLLMHPELGVAVSLDECAELAKDAGHEDAWLIAASFAAHMLPAIFRPDDAALAVTLAPEYRQQLEGLVLGLPVSVFTASDSLGWVYQFWQADEKDRVNDSEVKIGADELPAVTQLFTEPYMVQFLLHNSLGAWWAAKRLTPAQLASAGSEQELRDAVALPGYTFTYLRFVREDGQPWRPAAGTFPEWPRSLKGFKTLDPCCGSGHFLVELLHLLARLRMADEGQSARAAVDAVLIENLHGLEIDQRCTQIAAFAVALAAWTFPGSSGHRPLPAPHIACSGLRVAAKREEWMAIADRVSSADRERLRQGMGRLWDVFQQAPVLGSLLDPGQATGQGDLFTSGWAEVQPLLAKALSDERVFDTEERAEIGVAARGLADAAQVMSGRYQLVATNVPYLARGKQHPLLAAHSEEHYPTAKADLANVFLERCLELAAGGVAQVVMPQNWLFLTSYRRQREQLLRSASWNILALLGPKGFQTPMWDFNVQLVTLSALEPQAKQIIHGVSVFEEKSADEKAAALPGMEIKAVEQAAQLKNPDARVSLSPASEMDLLERLAQTCTGIQTFDSPRFLGYFWEYNWHGNSDTFISCQTTVPSSTHHSGRSQLLRWENGLGGLAILMDNKARYENYKSGIWKAWLRHKESVGVCVSLMGELPATLFYGNSFDNNSGIIVPADPSQLPAIWCFCSSSNFNVAVRKIDQKLNVTNATLVKVPFDLNHWAKVAQERYPHGLPKYYTDDPTQWIFHGHPCGSVIWSDTTKRTAYGPIRRDATVLPVALARLLGYRWPAELDPAMDLADEQRAWVRRCDNLQPFADDDGIVCLPSVRGEAPAGDRLRDLLTAAYGNAWSAGVLAELLSAAGHAGRSLESWLRDYAFKEHCALFQQRPFIWHIWDGAKDGFSAFVNHHKLTHHGLQNLTYTYLGDWIKVQQQDAAQKKPGADLRRDAALALQAKLAAILEGEAPYDIFVRWKPLHEQPLGWEPDLDDGVRLNIRPFITAEVLRAEPKIKYTKDRGQDPESAPWYARFTGERINDHHTSLVEKRAERTRHATSKPKAKT